MAEVKSTGKVVGVNGNLMTVEFPDRVMQNEVAFAKVGGASDLPVFPVAGAALPLVRREAEDQPFRPRIPGGKGGRPQGRVRGRGAFRRAGTEQDARHKK